MASTADVAADFNIDPSIPAWYRASDIVSKSSNAAQDAYEEALAFFKDHTTRKPGNREWFLDTHSINDAQKIVQEAKLAYDKKPRFNKARSWLHKLSTRLMYYSSVMDMLSQHHPEYVSLVWGAVKFILTGIINQEELVKSLSKGLCQIADALPRVEFKLLLYPTYDMKKAVEFLYAQILKFLKRAASWYKEGKLKHMMSAIVRPYPLHFEDLVEEIAVCARKVDQLAVAGQMAEMRVMHVEQTDGWQQVAELRKIIEENHKTSLNIQLSTSDRVCQVQLSQIMSFTATTSLSSPQQSLHEYQAMRNRRKRLGTGNDILQNNTQLKAWGSSEDSSIIGIKGSFSTKSDARDFCVNLIDLIRSSDIPVIWVLNCEVDESPKELRVIDVMKQLVLQALQINEALATEKLLTLNAYRFQSATTEHEWFLLLGSVLAGLSRIYIVVDVEILGRRDEEEELPWLGMFASLLEEMTTRGIKTVVTVALVSYGTVLADAAPSPRYHGIIKLPKKNAMPIAKKFPGRKSPARGRRYNGIDSW